MESTASTLWKRVFSEVEQVLLSASGCHDFSHTLRVVRNTERIAVEEFGDCPEVVRLGALLHDVARPEEIRSHGAICHAEHGAFKSREILLRAGCRDEFLLWNVPEIVRTHRFRSGSKPELPEAMVVYDADKLDSIGAFGVARAFYFAGHIGACLHNTETEALTSGEYSSQDTAYREYLVKLRYIPDRLLTQTGRRLAASRVAFMTAFFDRLNGEEKGEI